MAVKKKRRTVTVTDVDIAFRDLIEVQKTVEGVLERLESALKGEVKIVKPKTAPNPEHTPMKKAFMDWYIDEFKVEYVWSGVDARHLNLLISKFNTLIKANEFKETASALDGFNVILQNLSVVDDWIYDNVSIALINSKFNNIISRMMMPKGKKYEIEDYKRRIEERLKNG